MDRDSWQIVMDRDSKYIVMGRDSLHVVVAVTMGAAHFVVSCKHEWQTPCSTGQH